MNWNYSQKTGQLFDPSGKFLSKGYSGGNQGKDPIGINNPAMESIPNVGPIPRGAYTFGTPVAESHLGPFAIPLIPDPANGMFGRSGFFIHGDTSIPGRASQGCIVMARAVRNLMWESSEHKLTVI